MLGAGWGPEVDLRAILPLTCHYQNAMKRHKAGGGRRASMKYITVSAGGPGSTSAPCAAPSPSAPALASQALVSSPSHLSGRETQPRSPRAVSVQTLPGNKSHSVQRGPCTSREGSALGSAPGTPHSSITPVQTLPSPQWRKAASPSAVRSSCREGGPGG